MEAGKFIETDFLVIGSGIAGLTYAIKVARHCPDKKVTIITKASPDETNTKYAQGGIAVVNDLENDSFEKHIVDTLVAGDGLCNREIVEIVVKEGPARVQEIIDWGAKFDKDAEGDYKLGREGGHSEFRILHHKDVTGMEMERTLLEAIRRAPNIELVHHCFVIDIITQHHLGYLVTKSTPDVNCYGVYVLNSKSNRIEKILSKVTMLATGGNGQVYRTTTNPYIATGDGVAMVYRAKGRIENMEFIQFHPTALYEAGKRGQAFLITEAVRGDGGILRNVNGEAFMEKYDQRKDLAPRDIVARAIDSEMKISGTEHVYLDCRHIEPMLFQKHFKSIWAYCQSRNIDPAFDVIPIVPVAHYQCGGISVDRFGQSSVANLFAIGECARTGFHGKNRLASNSLLEAAVFAHQASGRVCEIIDTIAHSARVYVNIAGVQAKIGKEDRISAVIYALRTTMQQFGVDQNHENAIKTIKELEDEAASIYKSGRTTKKIIEALNMIEVALLMITESKKRKLLTQIQVQ